MDLSEHQILVTGADGFIGSHLTEELVRRGCRVRAFVYYNSFNTWGWLDDLSKDIAEKIDVWVGDVRDAASVRGAMRDCSIVMHLAALISIPYSYRAPESYVETNVRGTLNILETAKDLGVAKIVHTSTSEVYGSARFVPITEDHPLQGQSPYSASKIGADHIAMSYYHSFDSPVTIIRPFNTYGPRQSARAVIPTIITQIASGSRLIRLGSLEPTRDFSYVSDTVQGFCALAESDNTTGEVINIGSNFEVSIGDTLRLIGEVMDADVKVESDDARLRPQGSEVERLWADNTKAKELAGWEPVFAGHSGMRRALTETVQWYTSAENLSRYKPHIYNL